MTRENAIKALEELTIGHTKVINGKVVTRWSATSWEIGTWGKATMGIEAAAVKIM